MNHEGYVNMKGNLMKPVLLFNSQSEIFSSCIDLMRNYDHGKIFQVQRIVKCPKTESLISKNT